MGETYYDILGVCPDATHDEITAAYRERVLETHPDHNDAPDATAQFKQVQTAADVLTDGTERARYDRLGHDAYVRLGTYGQQNATGQTETAANDSGSAQTTTGRTRRTNSGRRHRRTRRRQTKQATGTTATSSATADERWRWFVGREAAEQTTAATGDDTTGYAVHDWTDDIEPAQYTPRLDQRTRLTVGAVACLYPLFVYSSLTPSFPALANVIVALCTIALSGYLLTIPRVAVAVFGVWSALFSIAAVRYSLFEPVSLLGGLALGFVFVPFGYALVIWWSLRP